MTIDSDSARFSRALRSAVLWPVGIIFVTAILFLLFIFMLFRVVSWSDHSYQVLVQTHICENLIIRSQNDVRGYLLTGDPAFVASYEASRDKADPALRQLKSLVGDNPEQVIRAQELIQATHMWFDHAQTIISHRTQAIPINADWIKMGRTLMDTLRSKFDTFIQAEEILRDHRLGSIRRMKQVLAYTGGALVILLALSITHVIRKQMLVLATNYRAALDATEQRHAALMRSELDLEEQKEWLRVTLTSIGDGVIVTDPESRVLLMNPESERLTGWRQVDALHHPLIDIFKIVNEETRHPVDDPVGKVLLEKKVVGLANHTVLLSRTGEAWPIEDSAAPICGANGKILGVVMVFHDASEMRRTQNSLKAYSHDLEKQVADRTTTLQQAVADLQAFSYTVSHDLRAPLRAMQGFSEAVLEDYADKLDERGRSYLERIKNASQRLDGLIQDLLSYTRISREDVPLEPLDLSRILRDVVEHDPNLNPPAAEIRVEGTLPKVLGREALLTQVLSNLLGNAIRFVAPGTVPRIRVRGEDRGQQLRVWIEDNGLGIAPEYHGRIFEMFAQINDAQAYGGTGVGLAIVKKAVQAMRGSVGLESQMGASSRFWVELNKA